MKSILSILFVLVLPPLSMAQAVSGYADSPKEELSQFYIETDPTALVFSGFSLAVRRSATLHRQLILGLGMYKTTLPEFYINAVKSNAARGWQASNFGLDAFADYFVFDPNQGLSIGFQLGYYHFKLTRAGSRADFQSVIETLRIGYVWRPIRQIKAIYLFPWVGVSTHQKVSGTRVVEGETFLLNRWSFVPTIQLGVSL